MQGGKAGNPQLANQQGGQPVFHGNQNVPITEIDDRKFLNLLSNRRGGDRRLLGS